MDALKGIDTSKLVRVTVLLTASQQISRSWKLLPDRLKVELLTEWFVANGSDLAIEQIIATVPELKIWKINFKVLQLILDFHQTERICGVFKKNCIAFPAYHEVRFDERFRQ